MPYVSKKIYKEGEIQNSGVVALRQAVGVGKAGQRMHRGAWLSVF